VSSAGAKVAEQFARETDGFVVEVLHQDGDYRHIRFGRPGETWGSTDVHTWPGGVVTSGDMADGWMFTRPLEFFTGRVNLHYWQEKLTRGCRLQSREFSLDTLRASVRYAADDFDVPAEHRAELDAKLADLIMDIEWDSTSDSARNRLDEFEFAYTDIDGVSRTVEFYDVSDIDAEDYTWHFTWACHVLHEVARHLAPTPEPKPAVNECGRCGYEAPATPGAIYRGCPRCDLTVEEKTK